MRRASYVVLSLIATACSAPPSLGDPPREMPAMLYDRYKANYFAPGKSRDSLSFDELHVRVLTPDFAYATARFTLSRPPRDSVVASGPFTLVLQRQENRWRILHDHTSADPK